jgi:hypothetical protein
MAQKRGSATSTLYISRRCGFWCCGMDLYIPAGSYGFSRLGSISSHLTSYRGITNCDTSTATT